MVKNILSVIVFLFLGSSVFSQASSQDMTLIGSYDDNSLPDDAGQTWSDIWGYVDGSGREYAFFGSLEGTYFFDITVPASPVFVQYEPGGSNYAIWRDYKTYQNYLYAVEEQGGGSALQIFDLSGLPGSVTKVYHSQALFNKAHSIFVEEASGRLYVSGASAHPSGFMVFDIGTNPESPTLIQNINTGGYVHDIHSRNDTVYAFMGGAGFKVFDCTTLPGASFLGNLSGYTEAGYSHSGWVTDDHNYLVHADETHNTGMKVTDVSDLSSMNVVSAFRSTLLAPAFTNSMPHNPFIKGELVFIGYYHDGVQVFDISDKANPVQVAWYDASTNSDYSWYWGNWGVYPYLPSGNIIACDMEHGLQILRLDYVLHKKEEPSITATPLEGRVKLEWETGFEYESDGFAILRSSNGIDFEELTYIKSKDNQSTKRKQYTQFDESPLMGLSYYQLKQVSSDGEEVLSSPESVYFSEPFRIIALYPNPAIGKESVLKFSVENSGAVEIVVTDMFGKVLFNEKTEYQAGIHNSTIPSSSFRKGVYNVEITHSGHTNIEKLLIQ